LLMAGQNKWTRPISIIAGVKRINDPAVLPSLDTTINAPTGSAVFTGAQFIADSSAARFIKEQEIVVNERVRANFIGRPYCIDILSEIIVSTAVAQPVVVNPGPTGYLPPPTNAMPGPGNNVQPGFQPAPVYQTPMVAEAVNVVRIALPSRVQDEIENVMNKQSMRNSNDSRIVSLVDAIIKDATEGYPEIRSKFLNVSTGRFAVTKNMHARGSGGAYIGSGQRMNLMMKNEMMASILENKPTDVIDDRDPRVQEVFYRIGDIINKQLGMTLSNVSESITAVPLSILEGLPAGPRPAQRPVIVAKTPFVGAIPLPGVTDVTTPITDGKRCLPGLMAKKRD